MPPVPRLSLIESTGEVEISFSQQMRVLPALEMVTKGTIEVDGLVYPVLEMAVSPHFEQDSSKVKFSWEVTGMSDRYLRIKLNFNSAMYVSA